MDVRFESGPVLWDVPLVFTRGNRLTYRLTHPVSYIMVKRRHSEECNFGEDRGDPLMPYMTPDHVCDTLL